MNNQIVDILKLLPVKLELASGAQHEFRDSGEVSNAADNVLTRWDLSKLDNVLHAIDIMYCWYPVQLILKLHSCATIALVDF